jgi:glycosyltransferase involved in cell wall biosynthesis
VAGVFFNGRFSFRKPGSLRVRPTFRNREHYQDFYFSLYESRERDGTTAMLRAKNEEVKIGYCLQSIYNIFDEIVFVDNGSHDRTVEIVHDFCRKNDPAEHIKIYSYPFPVARCGPEHGSTPEDSVHSLVYFYNWSLSHCTCKYVAKWDADMIARKEVRKSLSQFLDRIQSDERKLWVLPGQTIYRALNGDFYRAIDEVNSEIRIFPYGFNPRFHKLDLYEGIRAHPPLSIDHFEDTAFYELKFVAEDEFSHWSTADFATPRKRRERENFQLIKTGRANDSFEKLPRDFLETEVR